MKNLLAPDPSPEAGGNLPVETPSPAAAPVAATPPPAAAAVIGGKTENEVNLQRELEEERAKRRKAETDAAYLSDENRQLKQQPTEPKEKTGNGWVFPDEE